MPYILNNQDDTQSMLKAIGVAALDDLFATIPQSLRLGNNLNLPNGLSEYEVSQKIKNLAKKNKPLGEVNSFLGAGAYDHYIPAALKYIISNPQFTTAYTPYQAEISQGILQAIYEYQSYICLLTGMDAANASLFDGASAFAEAVLMSLRLTQKDTVVIAESIHPEYKATLKTYLSGLNFSVREVPVDSNGQMNKEWLKKELNDRVACCVVQSPNFFGVIENCASIAVIARAQSALTVMVTNPFSLAVLKEPAELGMDIVCGEGQPLGGSVGFGGSSVGFLAVRQEYVRQMPGRIVGKTEDAQGRVAYCLTLQTREQHIRREKATSNICSNQSLHAIALAVYLALMGKEGVKECMLVSTSFAHYMWERLKRIDGITSPLNAPFLHEFVWRVNNAKTVIKLLNKKNIIPGLYIGDFYPQFTNCILSCCTEKKNKRDIEEFIRAVKWAVKKINDSSNPIEDPSQSSVENARISSGGINEVL